MRDRVRTTILTAALLATTPLLGTAGAAAAPTALYPPSALVLAVGPGDGRDAAAPVSRAVTLSCAPTPSGTHPAPQRACTALRAAAGDPAALHGRQRRCPALVDPVTATADGVWQGRRVSYRETFHNRCALLTARGDAFDF
ncbi:subtilase-type protease inhibitor [Streptomyces sp. NPDC092296]|uniref:subtilase-type protease inhibitor n=1 Tax=Streptomyces sp. NPDC092296 TaxID=3366012 RepID=UPI003806CCE1